MKLLSVRETEILTWLARGKHTREVACLLEISERTVKFHVNNITLKLQAINRTHAVAIALQKRLIEFE